MDRLSKLHQPCPDDTGRIGHANPAVAASVRRILVVNAKGGCGKTTLATNLAGYYAFSGRQVVLQDHDPQGSCTQWLSQRDESAPSVFGIAAYRSAHGMTRSYQMRMPLETERVVIDAPAGVHGQALIELVRQVDTILIPVLPSPIDIHAASHFIKDLLLVAKVRARAIRLGVVANRVRKNTLVYQSLERFLRSLDIPLVAQLRDTQNYVRAAEHGAGIHELKVRHIERDKEQWDSLLHWLEQD